MIFELAHALGAVPLLWLLWLAREGRPVERRTWGLAGVFGVSFVADTLAHVIDPAAIIPLYALSQTGLLAIVVLEQWEAALWIVGLALVAVLTAVWGHPALFDTVAGGSAALMAYRTLPTGLRESVVVTLGIGAVAWVGYTVWPGWTSWGIYQVIRLVGTALFCEATLMPRRCLCLT